LFDLKIDLFDAQWNSFRSGISTLLFFGVSQSALTSFARVRGSYAHLLAQLTTGIAFVTALHGYRIIFTLGIVTANYFLGNRLSGKTLIVATWVFNLAVLVLVSGTGETWSIPYLSFRGMSGWSHTFNMLMLKLISFNVDRAESKDSVDFSPLSYLAYCFYSPLFLAGPIMSYTSWKESLVSTRPSPFSIFQYAGRWLLSFILLEILLHVSYANAISAYKPSMVLQQVDSFALGISLSVAVLVFMWLKFLLIWRFFRFWSLLNGIDCPENMKRCVFNNYSMVQFWKDWHSSFNIWLVRYVYIPLGGSRRNRFFNVLVVFVFVALWHDLTLRVFQWAFLVVAIMIPELVCTSVYRTKLALIRNTLPGRLLKSLFATCNTYFLVLANMVGYVFGIDGVGVLMSNVHVKISEVFITFCTLYCFVTIMLWLEERRTTK
jgi:D-alanyl-lipoteichoic acid acyltransferase DltB (MBOAT superfamily)